MSNARLIIASLLSLILLAGSTFGVTADALASFLGVNGWHTVVDLPAESYSIEIWEFRDGKLVDRWAMSEPEWTRNPAAGISILAGPYEDKYKLSLTFSAGGTVGVRTRVPMFASTIAPSLPEKIKAGDFVLFAEPKKTNLVLEQNDLRRYSQGFVLRITKAE